MTKVKKDPELLPGNKPPANEEETFEPILENHERLEDQVENHIELHTAIPNTVKKSPSHFGRNLWRVIVFLFNLTIIILILGAIGAGLFFGWPIVYKQYVLPVQNHSIQISQIEKDLQHSDEQLLNLQIQMPVLMTEQVRHANDISGLESRLDKIETEIIAHTKSLEKLDELQNSLQAEKQDMKAELDRQIDVMKAMELLSRARLFLYQSNFGLSKQDIQSARDLLALTEATANVTFKNEFTDVVQRLDLCLSRLPDYPVTASDDLDIAWQLLLQGIPQPTSTPELSTLTPSATPELSTPSTPRVDVTTTP